MDKKCLENINDLPKYLKSAFMKRHETLKELNKKINTVKKQELETKKKKEDLRTALVIAELKKFGKPVDIDYIQNLAKDLERNCDVNFKPDNKHSLSDSNANESNNQTLKSQMEYVQNQLHLASAETESIKKRLENDEETLNIQLTKISNELTDLKKAKIDNNKSIKSVLCVKDGLEQCKINLDDYQEKMDKIQRIVSLKKVKLSNIRKEISFLRRKDSEVLKIKNN
ncbi:MAG: hypothetical protein MHPSP_000795 [Paramarteilia canceri]